MSDIASAPPARRGLGFFTRLLDEATPGERYRLATEQIRTAERFGFDSAWVAQHHFSASEGGLPAPLVFLSHVAAQTSTIRLGTGIVTLPLEDPVRVAEDAAVLDLLAGGRLELGVGSGGTASSFAAFGKRSEDRGAIFADHLAVLRDAFAGLPLGAGASADAAALAAAFAAGRENRLYPAAPQLGGKLWQATFSVAGGSRAAAAGDGLMLSRTQPRPPGSPRASLDDIQRPIVDAYYEALPAGATPRIMASRTLFVADDRAEALRIAEPNLRRAAAGFRAGGQQIEGDSLEDLIAGLDTHIGTVDDVIESLAADRSLDRVSDVVFQVHSVDPPHELVLRSIELIATQVAPALGIGHRSLESLAGESAAHTRTGAHA
ncbi:putative FMN-dependent luciferase-like monooxygenase [Microterricola viridarii]|uniref:Putative FMN-dependent luciferase-like monooxygenase, KPN_01858 family n=1 Tax=Microterricola viridarii TaxID=412690 RepID=A0A1H1YAU8_9MICO|nr:putative FMN-dependent luciferase-like monooxygenase [Microterricola viridarii]SDT18389.1 putative FMN-dependent luciferase-like monooxygenase, KPN_01858 family [Microterricola viridarii]